ncbi:hypothetical protein JCM10213_006518 [Rhodosporidiobolus nylandii]
MGRKVVLTLHRNDLRIHDNGLLHYPHQPDHEDTTHVLPLYVFDERFIELGGLPGYERDGPEARTRLCGFWRTSAFRARFMTEGVYDLRDRLRQRGSDLLVRFGKMEVVATQVVKELMENGDEIKEVCLQKEYYAEELTIERKLRKRLAEIGVHLEMFDQVPLIHPEDLPFSIPSLPDVFTPFRKRVESLPHLGRAPLPMPSTFKPFPYPPSGREYGGYGADLAAAGIDAVLPHLLKPLESTFQMDALDGEKTAFPFKGGESTALERVEWYFERVGEDGEVPPMQKYKETRNGLLGHAYSTKLSPFLCLGMISPRQIIAAIDSFEATHGQTSSAYWLRFELLWRDYFMFIARKYGTAIFKLGGLEEITDPKQAAPKLQPGWWKSWDRERPPADEIEKEQPAVRWMKGKTGVPFVDANIQELRQSGFMSNRGRQNVASFLTKDLGIDWRIGAEFFESHLIDYEPSSNLLNWQYVSGTGNDPRASRQFNPIKQANDYDPQGVYTRTWLPQLAPVPLSHLQCPWTLPPADFQRLIEPGSYPCSPVVEQEGWKPHYSKKKRGPSKFGVPNRNEVKIVLKSGAARGTGTGRSTPTEKSAGAGAGMEERRAQRA